MSAPGQNHKQLDFLTGTWLKWIKLTENQELLCGVVPISQYLTCSSQWPQFRGKCLVWFPHLCCSFLNVFVPTFNSSKCLFEDSLSNGVQMFFHNFLFVYLQAQCCFVVNTPGLIVTVCFISSSRRSKETKLLTPWKFTDYPETCEESSDPFGSWTHDARLVQTFI